MSIPLSHVVFTVLLWMASVDAQTSFAMDKRSDVVAHPGVELYVGDQARRAILPRESIAEIVYVDERGNPRIIEGRVVAMDDSVITLSTEQSVRIDRVTRILVGRTKGMLDQAKARLIGPPARNHTNRREIGFVQAGFGGLIADSDIDVSTLHFMVGREVLHYSRIGIVGELGVASPVESTFYPIGTSSVSLVFHAFAEPVSLDPYVTIGGSYLFRAGGTGVFNVGVGLTAISGDQADLRMEIRDYIRYEHHLVEFRVGVGF